MDNKIAITAVILATFAIVGNIDLEPTHYCESRELVAHCVSLSDSGITCYTLPGKTGGKRCSEGWKELSVKQPIPQTHSSNIIVCDDECVSI